MGKIPADQSAVPDEPAAEQFDFDENTAEEIERAIDGTAGHQNERGLTNWHVS